MMSDARYRPWNEHNGPKTSIFSVFWAIAAVLGESIFEVRYRKISVFRFKNIFNFLEFIKE